MRRRGFLDRLVVFVFYRPFVCDGCHQRVRLYVTPLEPAPFRAPKKR